MKISNFAFALAAALSLGLATPGSAHQEVVGNLKIGHPWVREAAAGASGTYACIIEIKNEGDEPETLLGATIDGAGTGVIYQIIEKDGASQPSNSAKTSFYNIRHLFKARISALFK
jgi:copper(I)-binding protein